MTITERNDKLKHFIVCLKCEVSGKCCDDNCPTQYDAGNMGEIIENLEAISKALEQQPCEDVISRQAVLDKLNRLIEVERLQGTDEMGYGRERVSAYESMIFEINSEYLYPSVTPQPKTGRWIYGIDEDTGEKDLYAWTCSECEGKYPWQPKYCPNCGAKMESEDVEDKGEREDRATRKRG